MATTTIRPCTCRHEFQDQKYGKGMRLHTLSKKDEPRCTVCAPRRWGIRLKAYASSTLTTPLVLLPPTWRVTITGREVHVEK